MISSTSAPAAVNRLADLSRALAGQTDFGDLIAAVRAGQSGTIDGAWGSSAALATTALADELARPLLVVIPHPGDLDAWAADLASFLGQDVARFPAFDNHPPTGPADRLTRNRRARLLLEWSGPEAPPVVLTTIAALLQPTPTSAELVGRRRIVRVGDSLDLDEFTAWLLDHGYKRVDAVEFPGDFARRGGIVDIYPPDADAPARLELFGDEIESIRRFAADTQRSLRDLTELAVPEEAGHAVEPGEPSAVPIDRGHAADFLPIGASVVLVEPDELHHQAAQFLARSPDKTGLFSLPSTFQHLLKFPSVTVSAFPRPSAEQTAHLAVESVERLSGNLARLRDELDAVAAAETVLIACPTDAELKRLGEVLAAGRLAQTDRLKLVRGTVRQGFRLVSAGVVVIGSHELFHRDAAAADKPAAPGRQIESRAIDSFLELAEGDLVVHVSWGIARFRGMKLGQGRDATADPTSVGRKPSPDAIEDQLILEFRDGLLLYVPATRIDLVQKYVGGSKTEPELSKVGGTGWAKKKQRVEAAVHDLAAEMLQLQALRDSQPGFAYPPDSDWQAEFEGAFPYQETPDQLISLKEIRADMERAKPMDRLVCGDVGYGKTELALRAAFKAADNGKQVAVLVPTTILAEQHFRTFRDRFAEYPFVVECLSRFRGSAELKRIVRDLGDGKVDVVIGTHRLLSRDVKFRDLGLVIIDEEQRFGVDHKERLKRLRAVVDVLTLTATPIPRTLHSSLLGLRDISNLETPPPDRLPIETRVCRFDKTLIRQAILRELNRDGQVYFIHNRIHDIHAVEAKLRQIVPEARYVVAHGQQTPDELEAAMVAFVHKKADVLLATTIVESGVDIPNANTMFINEADRYGLADLHQLRGRVGRHRRRAYAYLLLDGDRLISPDAGRRLKAIEEFTSLGAGFKIALRDLEIRGAGNILGTQQSGHIAAVGYELYCQLLEDAVRDLKQQPRRAPLEVHIDLNIPAYLPRDYIAATKQRLEVYRRLSRIRDLERLDDFRAELRDRYGPLPEPVEWLVKQTELRNLAAKWRIAYLHRDGPDIALSYRDAKMIRKLVSVRGDPRLRVVDEKSAYFRLPDDDPPTIHAELRRLLQSG